MSLITPGANAPTSHLPMHRPSQSLSIPSPSIRSHSRRASLNVTVSPLNQPTTITSSHLMGGRRQSTITNSSKPSPLIEFDQPQSLQEIQAQTHLTQQTHPQPTPTTAASTTTTPTANSKQKHILPPPIYVPRADAILLHRQMQLYHREHTHAMSHGFVPAIPLPHTQLILEDVLLDFETSQKHGNIIWPLFEFLRRPVPDRHMSQEQELTGAGYGLGGGKFGHGVEPTAVIGHGPKAVAQQAAAAAAAEAAAKNLLKEDFRPLTLSDHHKDDLTLQPPPNPTPRSWYHPPPTVKLIDAAIPQTVVYEDGQILAWYFSSSGDDGSTPPNTILKKKKENCTNENLIKVFLDTTTSKKITPWQSMRDLDVVATFYPKQFANDIHQVVPMFLTRTQFEHFVRNRSKKLRINGILQSFVAPRGTHNTILRVEWTPATCKVLERTAGLPIENPKTKGKGYDIDSRLTTFERNWQIPVSEGALLTNHNWSEAERKQYEEDYLDMMLDRRIFGDQSGLTRGVDRTVNVKVTNTVGTIHNNINPYGQRDYSTMKQSRTKSHQRTSSTDSSPQLFTTLAYNEHKITQIECLDTELVTTLTSYSWAIADHLRRTLVRHVRGSPNNNVEAILPVLPIKMSLYFKLGAGNKLWFLFMDELLVSQGTPKLIDRLGREMNDPLRDNVLKVMTPPSASLIKSQDPSNKSLVNTSNTAESTQQFIHNLPVISPTTKRAPFNPRMMTKEWLRYKWSHKEGEFEWNRTLGILELHSEQERERLRVEQSAQAWYQSQKEFSLLSSPTLTKHQTMISTASLSQPTNIFKQRSMEMEVQPVRIKKDGQLDLRGVPLSELPGTIHRCDSCHQEFELSADSILSDHKLPIQDVLPKLVAQRYIHHRTHPTIWYQVFTIFYPNISEEKCKRLLRSRKWSNETMVQVCDFCWADINGCPRKPLPVEEEESPSNSAASLESNLFHAITSFHSYHLQSQPRMVILSDETLQILEESLREYLHLSQTEEIFFNDSTPDDIQRLKEKEIEQIQQASIYTKAHAQSLAHGMDPLIQQSPNKQLKSGSDDEDSEDDEQSYHDRSKSSGGRRAMNEEFELEHAKRQMKLAELNRLALESNQDDPARQLFPSLLTGEHMTTSVTGPTITSKIDPPTANDPSSSSPPPVTFESLDNNLAAYHRHLAEEKFRAVKEALLAHGVRESTDGISPDWLFLKNSQMRSLEAIEREQKRLERLARRKFEEDERARAEQIRLFGDPSDRYRRSERFRIEWLQKLQHQAELRLAEEKKLADEQNRLLAPKLPFPLMPAAGINPKFPSPELVANYVRAHGLPESYIEAYEKSYVKVIEPAKQAANQHYQHYQQSQLGSIAGDSHPSSSSSSARVRSYVEEYLVEEGLRRSKLIYGADLGLSNRTHTKSPQSQSGSGRVRHTQPWQSGQHTQFTEFDSTLLPPTHANSYTVNSRPETSLNVYPRLPSDRTHSSRDVDSGIHSSNGRSRSISPISQPITDRSDSTPTPKTTLLPYLTKSSSSPILRHSHGPGHSHPSLNVFISSDANNSSGRLPTMTEHKERSISPNQLPVVEEQPSYLTRSTVTSRARIEKATQLRQAQSSADLFEEKDSLNTNTTLLPDQPPKRKNAAMPSPNRSLNRLPTVTIKSRKPKHHPVSNSTKASKSVQSSIPAPTTNTSE